MVAAVVVDVAAAVVVVAAAVVVVAVVVAVVVVVAAAAAAAVDVAAAAEQTPEDVGLAAGPAGNEELHKDSEADGPDFGFARAAMKLAVVGWATGPAGVER